MHQRFPRGKAASKPSEGKKAGKESRKGASETRTSKGKAPAAKSDPVYLESDVPKIAQNPVLGRKDLRLGCTSVGIISKMTSYDAYVSLPNSTIGILSISNISQQVTSLVSESIESEGSVPMPLIEDYFSVGDSVLVKVVRPEEGSNQITLSTAPHLFFPDGDDTLITDLNESDPIVGSVRSVEDKGYIIDFGLLNQNGKAKFLGFLNRDDIKVDRKDYPVGAVLLLSIKSVSADRNRLSLSLKKRPVLRSDPPQIDRFFAGVYAEGTISKYVRKQNSAVVRIFHDYFGSLSLWNTPYKTFESFEKENPIGQRVTVRVIFLNPDTHKIALSMMGKEDRERELPDESKIGVVYPKGTLTIVRVEKGGSPGVLAEESGTGSSIFIPLRLFSDEPDSALLDSITPKKKLQKDVRITAVDVFRGIYIGSCSKSILSLKILSITDVSPGQILRGLIQKKTDRGYLVWLNATTSSTPTQRVYGFLPFEHTSEVGMRRNLAVNSKIRVRVLDVDLERRRVTLTIQQTILDIKKPVSTLDESHIGEQTHGIVVRKIPDVGLLVKFFNNVLGFLPQHEYEGDKSVRVGNVKKVTIVGINDKHKRYVLSLKSPEELNLIETDFENKVAPGSIVLDFYVQGSTAVGDDGSRVKFTGVTSEGYRAFIWSYHLSDSASIVSDLKKVMVNDILLRGEFVVLLVNKKKGLIEISHKASLIHAARQGMAKTDGVRAGSSVIGYVSGMTNKLAYLNFVGGGGGIVPRQRIVERGPMDVALDEYFHLGQSLVTKVESVTDRGLVLDARCERKYHPDLVRMPLEEFFKGDLEVGSLKKQGDESPLDGYEIGATREVTVQKVLPGYGAYVTVAGSDDKGFILEENLSGASVGDSVEATIIDLDCRKGMIDFTTADLGAPEADSIKEDVVYDSTVILLKRDYLVVSVKGVIGFVAVKNFNEAYPRGDPKYVFNTFSHGEHVSVRLLPGGALGPHSRTLFALEDLFKSGSAEGGDVKDRYQFGDKVRGKVIRVNKSDAWISVPGSGSRARAHCVFAPSFRKWERGQELDLYVVGVYDAGGSLKIELSEQRLPEKPPMILGEFRKVKAPVPGVVMSVDPSEGLVVSLSPYVKVEIHKIEISTDPKVLESIESSYKEGTPVTVTKLAPLGKKDLQGTLLPADRLEHHPGDVVLGCVKKVKKSRVEVSLGGFSSGTLWFPYISDESSFSTNPFEGDEFSVGQLRLFFVLGDADRPRTFHLSLSPRLLDLGSKVVSAPGSKMETIRKILGRTYFRRKPVTLDDVVTGSLVEGVIERSTDKIVNVVVGCGIRGIVFPKNLSDGFVTDVKKTYPAGKPVLGKVMRVKRDGELWLTLSKSQLEETKYTYDNIEEGQVHKGRVIKVLTSRDDAKEEKGMLIKLLESEIVVFAHINDIVSKKKYQRMVGGLAGTYKKGDLVRVKILRYVKEEKKVYVGLREQYFVQDEEEEEEEVESEEEESEEESEESSSDEEDESEESSSDEEDSESEVGRGFKWGGETLKREKVKRVQAAPTEKIKAPVEEPTEDSYTKKVQEGQAESVEDFERLLVGSPNSSELWISFMSFFLAREEVDKARKVARKALQMIELDQIEERMNIWTAMLNLEKMYGDEESLLNVFYESVRSMDAKVMYLRLCESLAGDARFRNLTERLYEEALKKFSSSVKVWKRYIQFAETADGLGMRGARDIFQRALRVLPKKKHLKITQFFAIEEFKRGDPEKGRTIMEKLVGNYPKKVDIWSVYIDQECSLLRAGRGNSSIVKIRNLFERATSLPLNAKKIKFFFKKWLKVEEEFGDAASMAEVKKKAIEFVNSRISSSLEQRNRD